MNLNTTVLDNASQESTAAEQVLKVVLAAHCAILFPIQISIHPVNQKTMLLRRDFVES
jgi:hypothetical protein